jgi:origin recognition complex subunit 4
MLQQAMVLLEGALTSEQVPVKTASSFGKQKQLAVVFKNFDRFASDCSRQALLYSLFDCLQKSSRSIVFIATSTRMVVNPDVQDTLELLEKRVKSRFSHRQLYFPTLSLDAFVLAMQQLLLIEPSDRIKKLSAAAFNSQMDSLLFSKECATLCGRIHGIAADLHSLSRILMHFVLSLRSFDASVALLQDAFHSQFPEMQLNLLASLNVAQLSLLVAAKRLMEKGTEMNFEIVYYEYKMMGVESGDSAAILGGTALPKNAAFKAFKQMVRYRIFSWKGNLPENFRLLQCNLLHSEISRILLGHPACPTNLRKYGRQVAS